MKTYTEKEVAKLIHDIKNPLTSIISFSKMLIEDEEIDPEEKRELLQIIYEEAERISDILTVFRSEKKKKKIKEEKVKVAEEELYPLPENKSVKILVVDDDGSIRRIIKMDLEKAGFIVYTAYNGKEALELVRKIEPDIIISDINMPEINGFELYEALKKEDILTPFIFLTAQHSEDVKINSLKLGVDAYLTKPFTKEELIVRVESLLTKAKKIEQNMYIDSLTKVYNRKFINERLPLKIKDYANIPIPASLVMCDIDFFKDINDTYGHQIGDKILSFLGSFLINSLREDDIVTRYGGDEFLILLKGLTKKDVYSVMERIREDLSRNNIEIGKDKKIKITISIGISSFPEDGSTLEQLIEVADKALYKAKETGRNKVVLAEN